MSKSPIVTSNVSVILARKAMFISLIEVVNWIASKFNTSLASALRSAFSDKVILSSWAIFVNSSVAESNALPKEFAID